MKVIKRFTRTLLLILGFGFIVLTSWGTAYSSDTSPNILLVIADDMGIDASPCYSVGKVKPNMPVIEEMCRSGVVFENVWSNPQCSPTRATILTGRYGFRTGVRAYISSWRRGNPGIRLNETSIHQLLDQRLSSRYAHAVIGKWHLSDPTNGGPDNPKLMGVGHYSGLIKNGHDNYWKWPRTEDGETQFVDGYATTIFTNEAIDWIGEQDNPWFLWLAYTAPHPPIHLPPAGLHTHNDLPDTKADIRANPLPYYLAMLEALDSELGRLLLSLSPDQRENTIVIFVGDNGTPDEGVQSPYIKRRAKSTLFEGGIHVPLIVAGAGVTRQGKRETALINTTDLFATIADLAGTGVKKSGDSISFKHLLVDKPGPKRSFIYAELHNTLPEKWNNGWAIRDSRYKLIEFEDSSRQSGLFNLIEDPFENTNLLKLDPTVEIRAITDGLTKAAEKLRQ
jgi:arylsulfatase A-like enzyme